MINFILGLFLGIAVSTVGFSTVAEWADLGLAKTKTFIQEKAENPEVAFNGLSIEDASRQFVSKFDTGVPVTDLSK
ncbi:uncharacterized protein METZ01_LOCUS239494 [marine metagenome]|uniref:Uncharacterized protein n=1 Tax=marine metagenome TaxID=408172 RepID=A0A382HH66_9ZZZZ